MSSFRLIKLGRITALVSFLIGSGIFGLYLQSSAFGSLFVGYVFILLSGFINIGVLIFILLKANKDKENRKKLLSTCAFMILNIPVMLFYCWIAIILLNTMRITFINATKSTLTKINVLGCGGGYIDNLDVGESKTVWVDIKGDCSISIDYLSNGQRQHESVVGYTTNNDGQRMNHNIGVKNEVLF
jgi:hypothetical protein